LGSSSFLHELTPPLLMFQWPVRMYTENFRISHNVCLLFYFWQFSKPTRAGDVKRRICFRMA
jgi:hypothetical protein